MIPHGSHPLLDPLWGTDQLDLVHDGCERGRFQKLEHIMHEDIVRRYLRSCWHQQPGDYNCGSCHSCLANMTFLHFQGVLDQFPVYDKPIDVEKLARYPVSPPATNRYAEILLELAEQKGTDPDITQALRTALSVVPTAPPGADALSEMQWRMNNLLEQLRESQGRIWVLEQQKSRDLEQQNERLVQAAHDADRQMPAAQELDRRLQAADARIAQLEAQVYRLTSSASWRLTAPLRAATEALRHLRKDA